MPRLSPKEVRKRKEELKEEQGDKCHIGLRCKHISGRDYRIRTGEDLLLDHINNNPNDNRRENHQLGCRPCNAAKNPRGKTRFDSHKSLKPKRNTIESEGAREGGRRRILKKVKEDVSLLMSDLTYEQRKNLKGRPKFDQWLREKLKAQGYWPYADVVNAGAVVADVEITATERWLKRDLSSEGAYDTDTVDGVVVVKRKGASITKEIAGPS